MSTIGIVIPVYNTEKYIKKCLDSVIHQSYKDFSVCIVDDGSTDQSASICDEYAAADSRIKVIHQNNQGIQVARLNGLAELDCDYFTTIDSDDWIELNTLEKTVPFLNEGIDVVSYGIIRYIDVDRLIYSQDDFKPGLYVTNDIRSKILPKMIWNRDEDHFGLDPSICNKVIRKELAYKYLLKANHLKLDYGQDVAVLFPLMNEVNSLMLLEDYCYFHRQRKIGEIPGYITDTEFNDKTYGLYKYLLDWFPDPELKLQIDSYYVFSIEYRMHAIYGVTKKKIFVFPFHNITDGKKIVLYGAGDVGKSYFDQLYNKDVCSVVGWIDSKQRITYKGYSVAEPESIMNTKFDYIVIATINQSIASEMQAYLEECGIESNKILF